MRFPLSPKSERAYHRISAEFDILFQALQADGDAPVRARLYFQPATGCDALGHGAQLARELLPWPPAHLYSYPRHWVFKPWGMVPRRPRSRSLCGALL